VEHNDIPHKDSRKKAEFLFFSSDACFMFQSREHNAFEINGNEPEVGKGMKHQSKTTITAFNEQSVTHRLFQKLGVHRSFVPYDGDQHS
jgi:hypothetical protein